MCGSPVGDFFKLTEGLCSMWGWAHGDAVREERSSPEWPECLKAVWWLDAWHSGHCLLGPRGGEDGEGAGAGGWPGQMEAKALMGASIYRWRRDGQQRVRNDVALGWHQCGMGMELALANDAT